MSNNQFVKLPFDLLLNEWGHISNAAARVYVSIRAMRGRKDSRGRLLCTSWDYIPFGYSDMLSPISKPTFVRAIEELRKLKLIKLVEPGKFPNKKAVYALCKYRK